MMSQSERRDFFDALYPSWDKHPALDGVPPLQSILSAGGVQGEGDLKVLFNEAADTLLKPAKLPTPKTGRVPLPKP